MTCKECYHYSPCKTSFELMGFTENRDEQDADERCDYFKNAADVVEASEYKRLCNKLSREERRVRKLKKRIEELEKGAQE